MCRVQCQQESITTEGAMMGSGAGPTELYPNGDEAAAVDDVGRENLFVLNDTREALSHDGSEHNSVSTRAQSISYRFAALFETLKVLSHVSDPDPFRFFA